MQDRGVQPNVISFSAAISACEKGGQWERALELLEEMHPVTPTGRDCAQRGDLGVKKGAQWERARPCSKRRAQGVQPNVVSFSAAISACEKGGQWERDRALEEMRPEVWSRA